MYKKEIVLVLFVTVFLLQFASAEIVFSQTKDVYNVGDDFNISITIHSQNYVSDFLVAKLVCGATETEIYRAPYTLAPNTNRQVQISTNLGNFLITDGGSCYIKAAFANEERSSQRFEVTRAIQVSFDVSKAVVFPGERINAEGKATKSDNTPLIGFVEIRIDGTNFSHFAEIQTGSFNFSFAFPSNIKSGVYEIKARAYERDSFGEIINEGTSTSSVRIKPIPTRIELALNAESFIPRSEVQYAPTMFDQAGEAIDTDIIVVLYSPDKKEVKKEVIRSGGRGTIVLNASAAPGEWKIQSKVESIIVERKFLVEELRELSYFLEKDTLTITNTGNVPYTGPVKITIDNVAEIKEIENLNIGETKKYRLIAPEGEHSVLASNGDSLADLGKTFFAEGTGKAISVRDFSSSGYGGVLSWMWVLLIILGILLAVYFYRRIRKKSYVGTAPGASSKFRTLPLVANSGKPMKINTPGITNTMIDKGEKQEASVVAIRLHNMNNLFGTPATDTIDSVLSKAKDAGAKVYSDGEYRIVVLAPALTRQQDNSLKAINFAQDAERSFNAHNKRYGVKIDFGIGAHHGDLIVEMKEGKFKFTSVSNVIGGTKRIASEASNEALMSESLHRKLVSKVKSTKLRDKNLYRIEKVTDRSAHEDFINKFRQRNK